MYRKKQLYLLWIIMCLLSNSCKNKQDIDLTGSWIGWVDTPYKSPYLFNITMQDSMYTVKLNDLNELFLNRKAEISTGDSIHITSEYKQCSFKGVVKNDTLIKGVYTIFDKDFHMNLIKQAKAYDFKRPQTPSLTHNPYHTHYVSIKNPQDPDICLDGDLLLPKEGKDFPAVVLVHGSGNLDKDETIALHRIFWVLADHLARNGIAVLRYDKRGVERSSGNSYMATSVDYASDALAAWNYLKNYNEIDPNKIGIIGHSEGGMISFMLAANHPEIPYIISIAGPGWSWNELLKQREESCFFNEMNQSVDEIYQNDYKEILESTPPDTILKNFKSFLNRVLVPDKKDSTFYHHMASHTLFSYSFPWYTYFQNYDPTDNIKKIKCPVFALNGAKDCQVISKPNLQRIDSLIRSNGNVNITIKEYPNINHMMQTCETGLMHEYALIEETFAPHIMEDITEWIKKTTEAL